MTALLIDGVIPSKTVVLGPTRAAKRIDNPGQQPCRGREHPAAGLDSDAILQIIAASS